MLGIELGSDVELVFSSRVVGVEDGVGRGLDWAMWADWDWISRARSMRVPMKTFVKPFIVVITDGGTDWERVWLTI